MQKQQTNPSKAPVSPQLKSSWLGKFLFWWTADIFKLGLRRPIEETDVYGILTEHESHVLSNKYSKLWDDELHRKKPSIIRLFIRACGVPIIIVGQLYSHFDTALKIIGPLCLGQLVIYFVPGQTEITKKEAYYYALGIVLSVLLNTLVFHTFLFYIIQKGMQFRLGLSGLVFKKVMRLSKSTTFTGMNGQVINLLTNDVSKFEWMFCFIHDITKGPVEIICMGYLIYLEIGWSALVGILFMCSFIPIQIIYAKKAAFFRLKTAKRTDLRVRFMNEIIQAIQVIKMYTWESSFAKLIDKIRRKEMNAIKSSNYISALFNSLFAISRISMFLSLLTFVLTGNVITARKVFIVTSLYNALNDSAVIMWPLGLLKVSEGLISMWRIQDFLLRSEDKVKEIEKDNDDGSIMRQVKSSQLLKNEILVGRMKNGNFIDFHNDDYEKKKNNDQDLPLSRRIVNTKSVTKGIHFKCASAIWTETDPDNGIFDVNLSVESGNLCAIIGPVGSGKSTLLNVIIGELDLDDGTVEVNGELSYAGQEPWLFGESIRQNILFVEQYDEKRYKEVCRVCALERDFEIWPYGDKTIVGERGVSLSGGQKARVNLARAIYRQADIYLLDDPLSAVDTHVGKHIFQECIQDFLSDKCVILVTHQLQYLKNVKNIIQMENGRITEQGDFRKMRVRTISSNSKVSSSNDESDSEENFTENKTTEAQTLEKDGEEPTEKENLVVGSVKFTVYKTYIKSVQSVFSVVFCLCLLILSQIACSSLDFFVAKWVNWEELITTSNSTQSNYSTGLESLNSINATENNQTTFDGFNDTSLLNTNYDYNQDIRMNYVTTYAILAGVFIYFTIHQNFAFFAMCCRASVNLHDKLFKGITRATMSFFNNNPSGRILNRFSMDIGNIDSLLPSIFKDSLGFISEISGMLIVVSIVNPWLIVPSFIMTLIFYGMRSVYIKTTRCLNRIQSNTRSPVYSHINTTIQGLSTVRTFNAQKALNSEYNQYQDKNTGALYLVFAATRAFALWLDITCCVYIAAVTFSFLLIDTGSTGGHVGLAISQVIVLIGMCQWGIRQSAELENKMVSVERIHEYSNLNPEPPLESHPKYRPPPNWPEFGKMKFDNVNLRYSSDGDIVLKNLTFEIKASEKVGIVGRTGAGKSSIVQALFRLADVEGKIEIDGIDIKTLGLHDFRNKIAIIPQDPILFSGTMRNNLDPFERKSDDDIWNALEQVELKQVVKSLTGGLQCRISDGGSNFSMGQRQLVCLARAILLNNKILVLDEATANVDPETDKLIQKTIRTKFSECTVLTIAHRLHTVMDSDRVLVMDAGQVAEFGQPYELLQRSGGYLKMLVDHTGQTTAATLKRIAEKNHKSEHKT